MSTATEPTDNDTFIDKSGKLPPIESDDRLDVKRIVETDKEVAPGIKHTTSTENRLNQIRMQGTDSDQEKKTTEQTTLNDLRAEAREKLDNTTDDDIVDNFDDIRKQAIEDAKKNNAPWFDVSNENTARQALELAEKGRKERHAQQEQPSLLSKILRFVSGQQR